MDDQRMQDLDPKRVSILKLSGDEVYYTAWYFSLTVKHSCSRFHCQKVLNRKSVPMQLQTQDQLDDQRMQDLDPTAHGISVELITS